MTKTLFQIVSEVMNIPIEKISDSSGPESIPEWDSFNMFVLLAEVEKEFKANFSLEETFNYVRTMPICRIFEAMNPTQGDVHSFLKSYQGKFKEISPDTIYDRDLRFLTEGLQLMSDVLTEADKTAFMEGFHSSYKR